MKRSPTANLEALITQKPRLEVEHSNTENFTATRHKIQSIRKKAKLLLLEGHNEIRLSALGYGYPEQIEEQYYKAYNKFCEAAFYGNSDGMHWAVWIVNKGLAGHKTTDKAIFWYRKGVEARHSGCMNCLGVLLMENNFLISHYSLISKLFIKARALGDVYASINLALIYYVKDTTSSKHKIDSILSGHNREFTIPNHKIAAAIITFSSRLWKECYLKETVKEIASHLNDFSSLLCDHLIKREAWHDIINMLQSPMSNNMKPLHFQKLLNSVPIQQLLPAQKIAFQLFKERKSMKTTIYPQL